MKYFFSELDEVTLTFGDIQTNSSGMEFIRIYFEKPVDYGFNFLESTLPALTVNDSKGFTDDEKKISSGLRYEKCVFNLGGSSRKSGGKKFCSKKITAQGRTASKKIIYANH